VKEMRSYGPTSQVWILTAGKVTAEACTNYPSPPEREFATHRHRETIVLNMTVAINP